MKNIRILEFPEVESATEIIRVLQKAPKWEPAMRGGKPFSVNIKSPFTFKINSDAAQNNEKLPNDQPTQHVSIEKKLEFPGGIAAFHNFISNNYKMPNEKGLSGKVTVSFVIGNDGNINDIKVIKDIGFGTGEEAIRVLSMCPKWIPGEQDGKFIRVKYTFSINVQSKK